MPLGRAERDLRPMGLSPTAVRDPGPAPWLGGRLHGGAAARSWGMLRLEGVRIVLLGEGVGESQRDEGGRRRNSAKWPPRMEGDYRGVGAKTLAEGIRKRARPEKKVVVVFLYKEQG